MSVPPDREHAGTHSYIQYVNIIITIGLTRMQRVSCRHVRASGGTGIGEDVRDEPGKDGGRELSPRPHLPLCTVTVCTQDVRRTGWRRRTRTLALLGVTVHNLTPTGHRAPHRARRDVVPPAGRTCAESRMRDRGIEMTAERGVGLDTHSANGPVNGYYSAIGHALRSSLTAVSTGL
jgi:hypothetical protein